MNVCGQSVATTRLRAAPAAAKKRCQRYRAEGFVCFRVIGLLAGSSAMLSPFAGKQSQLLGAVFCLQNAMSNMRPVGQSESTDREAPLRETCDGYVRWKKRTDPGRGERSLDRL